MSSYAVVSNGVVENVVVWDGESDWQPPENATLIELPEGTFVSIGCLASQGSDDSWTFEEPTGA
ncbi:hypothetical protein [Burkholderia cenocepacia]|uniref:hypothetical protein n=1 Tax=Burkholderia cenocepacia TaxID=95486 RepID=UPI0028B8A840|nr:hypothetical protein [Burkholderia cenocepacia]MDT6993899.1 hypothetical protein [Burkholderia cenocepacia]